MMFDVKSESCQDEGRLEGLDMYLLACKNTLVGYSSYPTRAHRFDVQVQI